METGAFSKTSIGSWTNIGEAALAVLQTAGAADKARTAAAAARAWHEGKLEAAYAPDALPPRPARPARPELLSPTAMPKRAFKGEKGRFALLHALAHIELNAIDLAFDMVARFGAGLPRGFTDDWMKVGGEEAKHFLALENRLQALGGTYGDLPAHDGLWEAAEKTQHDLLARLAVVPMVLEARGLDVTPKTVERLNSAGDHESAAILEMIYEEEKGHVLAGTRWFMELTAEAGLAPHAHFHALVRTYFRGSLKPPFNADARHKAGLHAAFYEPLTDR
ncbi:ferritin-like domain-containing protein [Tepidicaulis sp. LMO-SS28]|uniref:ferritin-like domain-containing protein n=1 Tax=Tepidicaulis sp. LMO-SS28 TaxID=3447455 RepID=UPI003EE08790